MPPAPKRSAGLLVHRARPSAPIEVLLAHPGGPYWANQDDGAWSIPKGEYGPDEDALGAARREFAEELGVAAPDGETVALGEVKQRGGKTVTAWTIASVTPLEPVEGASNHFELEWPPRSGVRHTFPEVDRARWFTIEAARVKILAGQLPFLDRLSELLAEPDAPSA
jgi:predicted NUDIX family NTP pyrophosphohydrolase